MEEDKEKQLNQMLGNYEKPEFLIRCRDFQFFCENVLSEMFPDGGLQEYMKEWYGLLQNYNRISIMAARGFAKTTVVGVAYPIYLAWNNKDTEIMVVSNSEKQAKKVLAKIKSTIESNPLLSELKPDDARETWSTSQINLKNGTKIYCRPFTKNIKGERVDFILMDEAESYEDPEAFFDYIVPTLKPNGKIALISTPEINGLIQLIKDRNLNYVIKSYPAIINNESIWPKRFPKEKLEELRQEIGEQYFQKNYMCNPYAESGQSIFSAESIRACTDKNSGFTSKDYGGYVYMGCDFAIASGPTADYDCYIVLEVLEDRAIIKYAETHRGWPVDAKVKRIKELYEKYNVEQVVCDESSIGAAIIEELKYEGIPIDPQSFQFRERNKLLNNLKRLFDNKMIKIPKDPNDNHARKFSDRLELELLGMHEHTSQNTNITHYVSTSAHDDTVMSLAMAAKKVGTKTASADFWGIGN